MHNGAQPKRYLERRKIINIGTYWEIVDKKD